MQIFAGLKTPVKLLFFSQKNACYPCTEQEDLLAQLSNLSSKIVLEKYDFVLHGDQAMNYRIDKIPATAVVVNRDFGIRFYGLTTGYEFPSLVEAIKLVSTGQTGLDPRLQVLVQSIPQRIHLQVLAMLTCPHCPTMVQIAHKLAYLNPNIQSDMVELTSFPYLAQKYNITGTPTTIVNETSQFVGALPAEATYLEILRTVNPLQYQQIVQQVQVIPPSQQQFTTLNP